MEIIQTLINEHIEDITVSPSIGFVCQLFVTAGPSSECYGSDLVNLASNLLDKEITENDGLHILQTVVKIFGSASTEIIQFTSNIVFENIRDSDNTEHLQILLQIANSIIPYLEDENALNFVLETTLEYLASNSITKIEHFYYYNILAAINNKIPDLIKQNATAIIENNIFIESGKKTNEYSQARLCLTCAAAYENEEENPLLSRWLCSIFHLLDNHFAVHPEAGTLCLSAIELIAAKCPSRMETIYKYPLNSPRYKKLESLLNNEEKQKLHEMVPPL
ncbi:hypothetical protein TVAG_025930 [Trichomonas vaginalis G3]|uniref:Uncharacterized protein n=1 Tax=Trichomonas vaginalis (strain ATCC PRA-98 / G3) TaxID=412133 RepID=A2G1Z0_TRIV3|nr:armadillo (ARM) repeat-containing protein family [Trichomonas vaginalis G3]EAX88825.1 hypothetical protein TVAG_025930 [Trichomonas vaginalis G3]KAI5531579.1 armadillo (ARM) repeat-containing protein family [Trichomonas vaginalis G3]|eukprot:XP_001301755.1 hypothetical protein [Trichomonas vaginalis G3]